MLTNIKTIVLLVLSFFLVGCDNNKSNTQSTETKKQVEISGEGKKNHSLGAEVSSTGTKTEGISKSNIKFNN